MKLLRNSFYTLLGTVLPTVLAITTVPFYVAKIGPARFGALAIAWLALGYFGQADFGIGRAITQRISSMRDATKADMALSVWSGLASMAPISLLGALLLYVSTHYFFSGPFRIAGDLRGELLASVWALALSNPVVAMNGVLSGALMGIERFRLVSLSNIVANSAMQILPLATAYVFGPNLQGLIVAALGARVLGAVMLWFGVWATFLRGQRIAVSRSEVKRLGNFGAWIMVTALISPIMATADRFVIGVVWDAAAVAAYAIPFQIAVRTLMLPLSICQAIYPRFAAEEESHARERCRQYSVFVSQIYAPVILGLICLTTFLMQLWLGSRLDPRSIPIARILLAGCWLNAVAGVSFAFIQARGKPNVTATLHLIELPLYVAMLFGLGRTFGLSGVGAAFSLRCGIDAVALLILAHSRDRRTAWAIGLQGALVLVATVFSQHFASLQGAIAWTAALCALSAALTWWQLPEAIARRLAELPVLRQLPGIHRLGMAAPETVKP